FSFAYVSLDTGTGALILFAAVQITMILLSTISGKRPHRLEWAGMAIAFAGFVYLVLPGVSAPSATGLLLMILAGIAWGMYTIRGHASQSPLADTAWNFLRTLPFVLLLAMLTLHQAAYSPAGVGYAVLSGAIASGLGYAIWYVALSGLSSTQAAVAQLLVPVLAAGGGILFVAEPFTWRLAISSLLILGGILIVTLGSKRTGQPLP
ncbi:MAG: DMT family transporter, partial [Gammaproteobacteria bacterium]